MIGPPTPLNVPYCLARIFCTDRNTPHEVLFSAPLCSCSGAIKNPTSDDRAHQERRESEPSVPCQR
jgi:hypothetical protein